MESDYRKMPGRTLFVTAFVLVTSAVFFTGCDYFLKKAETTPSTTMMQTEETTISSTAETTEETTEPTEPETTMTYETFPVTDPVPLDFFQKLDNTYTIDAIVNEVGPYARFECSNYYVWSIDDGTEVWVTPNTDGTVKAAVNVMGLDYTLLYSLKNYNMYNKNPSDYCGDYYWLIEKEFGPDLEYGWYILEENDAVYILICQGRKETRGEYLSIPVIKSSQLKRQDDSFIVTVEKTVYKGSEELPRMGPYSTPSCGLKMFAIPKFDKFRIIDENRCQLPFKGYLKDSKTWEIIETDLEKGAENTSAETGT